MRTVLLRSAMVMSPDRGGVFDTLYGLVRRGLGGRAWHGRQYVSWIHEVDFAAAIRWLIDHQVEGPVNLSSPHPLPYGEFMAALRRAARMPFGLPATRWMLEVGAWAMRTETELVLKSRRVVPGRLLDAGFTFAFPEWEAAARDLVAAPMIAIFDGHDDTLTRARRGRLRPRARRRAHRPPAGAGGWARGRDLRALRADAEGSSGPARRRRSAPMWLTPPLLRAAGSLIAFEAAGDVRIVRRRGELDAAREAGTFAAVLHMEGARGDRRRPPRRSMRGSARAAVARPGLEPVERVRARRPVRVRPLLGTGPG